MSDDRRTLWIGHAGGRERGLHDRFGKLKLRLRLRDVAVVLLFGLALGDGLGQIVRDYLTPSSPPVWTIMPARPGPLVGPSALAPLSSPLIPSGIPIRQITSTATLSSITLAPADSYVVVNATLGSFVVRLPLAPVPGQVVCVKRVDASANDVLITSNDLIDGCMTYVLSAQWQMVVVVFDGKSWLVN